LPPLLLLKKKTLLFRRVNAADIIMGGTSAPCLTLCTAATERKKERNEQSLCCCETKGYEHNSYNKIQQNTTTSFITRGKKEGERTEFSSSQVDTLGFGVYLCNERLLTRILKKKKRKKRAESE
jgi:hypothetical protein